MALVDEIAKKKAEDALIGAGDKASDDSDSDADASTDLPEDTDASEEDKSSPPAVVAPATKSSPSYVLVPLKQAAPPLDTKTDEQVVAPTPAPSQAPLETKTDEQVVAPLDQGEAPAVLPQVEKAQPVTPTLDKGEAPAQLNQVERATLVKLPAPDLGERGAPIPTPAAVDTPDLSTDLPEDVSTAAGGTAQPEVRRAALAGETPVALPPEPVVRGAQVGVTPKAQPVTPSPEAAPVTPPPRQTSLGLTPDEYKAQYSGPPTGTAAQPSVATADAGGLNINTDYSAVKGSYTSGRGGDGQVHGIILHASDGDEKSGIQTLTGHDPDHQVSAHYFVTKDGRIYNFVNDSDTAFQAGKTYGPRAQYNNASTIGIEQEHVDGKEAWAPAQVAATAKLVAYLKGKYNLSDDDIMGHSDVAPGRKIDPYNYPWKGFFAAVDSSTGAAQPAGAAQPTLASGGKAGAQPAGVGPSITGKATTFGYNDPEDNGVGAPKLGQLDTNNKDLVGIAVPQEALQAYVGAHPASWRTARVQVTGANGQQVMVPIVDLGPRDTSGKVVADFTQGLTDLTKNTGDQTYGFRIIPNAGPDVMKDPQAFADEQAAIKAGINTGARFQQQTPAAKKPSYVLQPMAPKSPQQQQAEQFAVQGQTDTLDELNRNTENPGQFWKTLQQPIQGVSDGARTAYADNFKQDLTKYAQDFYGEKDPDKAFNRAVGDANLGTFGQDVGRAATGVVGQVDVGINKMSRDSDNNALDRFAQVLHPESDGPGRAAFIKTLTDIQDPNLRAQTIGKLWAGLDPDKQASVDINGLVNSADNVANPAFQAGQAKEIAAKDAFIQKLFTPDPTARGTAGEWATPIGQMMGNTAIAFMPKILQTSAFAAQLYGTTRDRVKEEHPDWTDEQIAQNSTISTFAQLAPQEALIAASHGIMGPIARWGANPVIRFGIGGGVHLATGAAGGALMQVGANVAEGQDPGQDVGGAALQGMVQAAPFAVHGGVSGALTRPEERTVTPEAIPKVNQTAPLGEEPATPPPTTGPAGGAVHGATAETMASGGEPSESEAAPTVNEPQEPVIHPIDQEPAPDVSHAHLDLNTLADMSDLPDEQSRAEARAAIEPEPRTADITQSDDQSRIQAEQEAQDQRIRAEAESRDQSVQGGAQQQPGANVTPDQPTGDIRHADTAGSTSVPPELGRVRNSLAVALSPEERRAVAPDVSRLEQARTSSPEAFQQAYVDLRDKIIGRFEPILKAYGIDQSQSGSERSFAAGTDPRGDFTFHADDANGAQDARTVMENGDDVAQYIHSAVQEEIIHFAQLSTARDAWNAAGGETGTGQNFNQFIGRHAHQILLDTIAKRDELNASGNTKDAQVITDALHNSSSLYKSKGDSAYGAQKLVEALNNAGKGDYGDALNLVYELNRQLIQAGSKSQLSEENYAHFWDKFRPFFKQALTGLKKMYRLATGSLAKTQIGELVKNVERTIVTNDRIARGEATPDEKLQASYRGESDLDLAHAAASKDKNALAILKERYPGRYLPDHVLDIIDPKRREAAALEQQQAQREHAAEVQAAAERPEGKEHLLQAITKAGGLPSPVRMRALAAKGEVLTGEMARIYDAWKALPMEAKKELASEGVTYNKLFTKQGEGLDAFRNQLTQHPDYHYGTTGQLLSETERALGEAAQGRRVYGSGTLEAPRVPRPQRDESDFALEVQKEKAARKLRPQIKKDTQIDFNWDTPEGFKLGQETTGSGVKEPPKPPPPRDTTGDLFMQKPKTPAPPPALAEDKIRELNSSTFKPEDGLSSTWKRFTGLLGSFHSMVPEAGAKGAGEGTLKIQQWERYLKGIGGKIKTDSANTVRKVLDPVLKVSSETHPTLIGDLAKLNKQIRDTELAGKPVPAKWTAQRDNLEKIQNSNPLHLFQQAVLYRDLFFRSQVKVGIDVHGNPRYMQLPMGLTKNEVINKLVDLKAQIGKLTPEQQAGVKDSLRSHYRLVRDIKDELANRGFVIPKELTNPYYYPHLLLEHMSGHLGSPRINTQEDFRNYLINPVGSEKPIETNYVKAMLQHLVEVRSHNARADATEQYLDSIDKSAKYKQQVVAENNRRIDATGSMKNLLSENAWENRARADGLEIYTAQKRLPLKMEAMLDLKKISERIGHNIEGPNIAAQLRKLGVQITADDVKTAMSTKDPIKWALHPEEAKALDGILGRQELASKAGYGWGNRAMGLQQKLMQGWKWWHLFSPTSAVRYNYNLMAVDLEKAATVDPAIFKKLGPAFNEVRQFMKTGKYTSPEMQSAVEHDVVHSPTAHELNQAHQFPQLAGLVPPEGRMGRLANAANLGASFAGMRDRTFRYAKYLADLDRLKAGKSVPEVALHRDLEAQPSMEARAAQNAREMFVDYSALSPAGESLRKNMIPFYSWMEGNFRYHANLFRNFHDMSVPNKAELLYKKAPVYLAKAVFGRATRGFLLRAAMVNGGLAAWNAWQMQQNHIKDSDLSDEDKRHLFIITGKDPKTGKVSLMYVPTASSDIASWMGGSHFAKAFTDYMQGRSDLGHSVQHWLQGSGTDIVNKVAQSVRPEILGGVGALSGQNFFPNVMKPRPVPSYDKIHQMVSNVFDQPTADIFESLRNNKFLPSKNLGDNLKQMVLQQRYRDPQQENYYAARDRVDQFLQDKGADRTPGTSNNEQSAVVRNLRKSMYNGDVPNAVKFANILVDEYGYNSQKFAASLKGQNPLSALPSALKKEYMAQLSDFDKEQLADAYRYTARLQSDAPNAQAEAQKIFGPKNKPALNQQALQAAILAMQDESRRAAAAERLQQQGTATRR